MEKSSSFINMKRYIMNTEGFTATHNVEQQHATRGKVRMWSTKYGNIDEIFLTSRNIEYIYMMIRNIMPI
jgi:hypothetical protein